jgi:sugar phosphate isomerase/epimerase
MTANLRIGCQTITWGENQLQRFPEVFRASAQAGYAGLEIGFRHIQELPPRQLAGMLEEHGLELVASHVGGNLQDTGQAAGERQILDVVLDYLNAVGTGLLMYSGLKFENDDQFRTDLEQLRAAAERCRECGVQLLYHNHDWEFADGGRIMNALLEHGGPELGFCPDIGWVMKGGANVGRLLAHMGARVGAIHFKDFATAAPGLDTVMLGDGIAPLAEAAAWAAQHRPGLWLIAEQDTAETSAQEAIQRNADYMKRVMAQLEGGT